MVGKELKSEIMKFYKRKCSHPTIKEFINHELKKIDFSKIIVVERLKDVKKNKRGVLTHHANRGIRRDERFVCKRCGWKVDADYNAALNIRDLFISQGGYGALEKAT